MSAYFPSAQRYADSSLHRRCGRSGLQLPRISLGLWHNFGGVDPLETQRALVRRAFDLGVTHFDLANNYGPPPGSAEENFGRLLRDDLAAHRDELVISTKAGWAMWPGPYGERCSRKSMLASLDQSLRRLGVDYVDIYYAHRFDERTPLDETMSALDQAVRSGKALYAGVSGFQPEPTAEAARLLRGLGTPLLIHQPCYHMFDRWIERGLLETLEQEGVGCIVYCPLAQGLLTDKYLHDIPADSRAAKITGHLKAERVTPEARAMLRDLDALAKARGQSLAQMALLWTLRDPRVTSALIGASKVTQLEQNLAALSGPAFSADELARIDAIIARPGIPQIW